MKKTIAALAMMFAAVMAAGQTTGKQLQLSEQEAKYFGNEAEKPCGPTNTDPTCIIKPDPYWQLGIGPGVVTFCGDCGLTVGTLSTNGTYTQARLQSPTTGRIDMLSDDEWAELQKRRKAVADYEEQIARAHGVYFARDENCDVKRVSDNWCITTGR
jgi:hypothetical protein